MIKKSGGSQSTPELRSSKKKGLTAKNKETEKPKLILKHTHDSSQAILKAFDTVRKIRPGGASGGTTDEEQDLLRAMLVMATSGLDSMVKQIFRDCLPSLINADEKVRGEIEKYTQRKIKDYLDNTSKKESIRFLSSVLVSESQKNQIVS